MILVATLRRCRARREPALPVTNVERVTKPDRGTSAHLGHVEEIAGRIGEEPGKECAFLLADFADDVGGDAGRTVEQLSRSVIEAEHRRDRHRDADGDSGAATGVDSADGDASQQQVCEKIGPALVHRAGIAVAEVAGELGQEAVDAGGVSRRAEAADPGDAIRVVVDGDVAVRESAATALTVVVGLGAGDEPVEPGLQLTGRMSARVGAGPVVELGDRQRTREP
ncbi:MAG: hypothetical protein M3Q98_08260 [Actinomycetota bacterium]|nr:hypothetical protein [Actinomycetota bacterium]